MYEWESMASDLALKLVNERDPRVFPFGYYAYETCSTYGRGHFRWFASEKELLDFITLVDSDSSSDDCCCDEPHDFFDSYQRLKEAIEHATGKDTILSPELMENINICGIGWKIIWWGTFRDLCAGSEDFSRNIFGNYLNGFDDPASRSIIGDVNNVQKFVDVIKHFGLE